MGSVRTQPTEVAEFLAGRRLAVAGVSRTPSAAANAIFRRLRETGHEVIALNPAASEVEGERCYPDLDAAPGPVDGVVIAVPPAAAVDVVRQCARRGVQRVWFHRSFGSGSVSPEALAECERSGIRAIPGGCPLMYAGSVDPVHRCMRWWLGRRGRAPR
jgi:predicted CoA-binding protein